MTVAARLMTKVKKRNEKKRKEKKPKVRFYKDHA